MDVHSAEHNSFSGCGVLVPGLARCLQRITMSMLLEHINQMGPEMGDLTVDQPENHQWLHSPVSPVLSTPALVIMMLAVMANINHCATADPSAKPQCE
jgi:hypothetical protein